LFAFFKNDFSIWPVEQVLSVIQMFTYLVIISFRQILFTLTDTSGDMWTKIFFHWLHLSMEIQRKLLKPFKKHGMAAYILVYFAVIKIPSHNWLNEEHIHAKKT